MNASTVVSIYPSRTAVESAVEDLLQGGAALKNLSLAARASRTGNNFFGYYNACDKMKYWGMYGALRTGLWSMLFASAYVLVPGIGALVVAGPLMQSIVSVRERAVVVGGMTSLGVALLDVGVPRQSIPRYEAALKADQFILIVHSPDPRAESAKGIVDAESPARVAQHAAA